MSARFTNRSFRRVAYYFAVGDLRVERDLLLPDFTAPREIEDLSVEYCGKRVDVKIREAEEWLAEKGAPQWVTDRLRRTEKAVDTQICCDAFQLAVVHKIDRLFLYANDFDYVPLCRALKQIGINVNLLRLTVDDLNAELAKRVDGLDVVALGAFDTLFTEDPEEGGPS